MRQARLLPGLPITRSPETMKGWESATSRMEVVLANTMSGAAVRAEISAARRSRAARRQGVPSNVVSFP